MAKISDKLIEYLTNSLGYPSMVSARAEFNTWDKNYLSNVFLKTNLCIGNSEIPIAMIQNVVSNLKSSRELSFNEVAMPIGYTDNITLLKTPISIIGLLLNSSNRKILRNIITKKDEIYHGFNGIIFSKDMSILYCCTLDVVIREDLCCLPNKLRVYIHPSVFMSDGTVEKQIAKNFIPVLLSKEFTLSGVGRPRRTYMFKPEIVIKDVTDKFLYKPTTPINCTDEDLNQVLSNNIDEILKNILS